MSKLEPLNIILDVPTNEDAAFKILVDGRCVCIIPRKATYSSFNLAFRALTDMGICPGTVTNLFNTLTLTVTYSDTRPKEVH